MSVRILIAGGGTGGHLFPGLALADELRARGAEVTFVGTARGIEARVVPRAGFPLLLIDVAGLKRMGAVGALRGAARLPLAAWQTWALLRRVRPDGVVGVGGYVSGPVGALAALLRIPLWVLEQNSVPGVTNRILGRLARRVYTAFPEAATYFPGSAVRCLGNPIRGSLLAAHRAAAGAVRSIAGSEAERRPSTDRGADDASQTRQQVLVLGGSQGAHAVNELMAGAVELLARAGALPFSVVHQTGAQDEAAVRTRYQALGLVDTVVTPFIEDMGRAYAAADLVIGRAGATTLAELTAVGLPAILIPLPTAADDHQTKNARWLEQQGAARVLLQGKAQPQDLTVLLEQLLAEPDVLQRMAAASKALGRPQAAASVATEILSGLTMGHGRRPGGPSR